MHNFTNDFPNCIGSPLFKAEGNCIGLVIIFLTKKVGMKMALEVRAGFGLKLRKKIKRSLEFIQTVTIAKPFANFC